MFINELIREIENNPNKPQIELILARHYQGWSTEDMVTELEAKFETPMTRGQVPHYRRMFHYYRTIDDNPLAIKLWKKGEKDE